MNRIFAAALAVVVLGWAGSAAAAIQTFSFDIFGGSWGHTGAASNGPYGLGESPTITGWVTIDTAKSDASAFMDLSYTTGTRTWTVADLDASSKVFYDGIGRIIMPQLIFNEPNNSLGVGGSPTVRISDGLETAFCDTCFQFESGAVPEPATWAMLIAGFGLSGHFLRRQRWSVSAAA